MSRELLPLRCLGRTSLMVTPLCVGGSPLASVPEIYGEEVDYERALDTVRGVFDSPINFLDTSNNYGAGESERRIGSVIAERKGLPPGFVLATKVDRDPRSGDFSADRVRRSAEESLERLGISYFQLLYLHDPEEVGFDAAMARGGPVEGLIALRDAGMARYIGVAGGPVELMSRFVRTGAFEALITHNRFTLVDRSAEPLIAEAFDAGLGVVNGAVFGGGILAKGPSHTDRYAYSQTSPDVLGRVRAMEIVCRENAVPLKAAALQASVRDHRVSSTIIGASTRDHVDELVDLMSVPVPPELWEELAALLPPETEWLH